MNLMTPHPHAVLIYAAQPGTLPLWITCIHAADGKLRFTHALTSVAVLIKGYLERALYPPITWDKMTELVNLKHAGLQILQVQRHRCMKPPIIAIFVLDLYCHYVLCM